MIPEVQGSLFHPPPRDVSVRVGPAGWNYKDWEGIVYPKGAGRSFDPLAYLADYFDTIEINSSFYGPPRPSDATGWVRRVRNNPNFKFTAKAWKQLTHEREEDDAIEGDCDQVRDSMAPLAEAGALGALLLQFPWSFRFTEKNLDYLSLLFRLLGEFPLALEVRHAGWDNEEFYDFLKDSQVAFCNIDQPVIGKSLRPAAHVTSRIGYFRMHGRNYKAWFKKDAGRDARYDYLYTREEVRELAGKIKTVKQGADETYAITNNHFRGQALVTAVEILEELDARPPEIPALLVQHYPEMKEPHAGG